MLAAIQRLVRDMNVRLTVIAYKKRRIDQGLYYDRRFRRCEDVHIMFGSDCV